MATGQISGPLLKSNLERNGVDLAIDTDLLYVDVINGRIGIKTATPSTPLDVVGDITASGLVSANTLSIDAIYIETNVISSISDININPNDAVNIGGFLTVTQNASFGGEIRGPANTIINPTPYDNTGQVTIAGNLVINGDTTTINSSTVVIADKNLVIGSGSTDATVANGAGITVDLGSNGTATLTYNSVADAFQFNKTLLLDAGVSSGGNISAADITMTGALKGPAVFLIDPATHGDVTGVLSVDGDLIINGTSASLPNTSIGNITTSGYIRGPATLNIDPASYGDNTGLVNVQGSLTVGGATNTASLSATSLTLTGNMTVPAGFEISTSPALDKIKLNGDMCVNHFQTLGDCIAVYNNTGATIEAGSVVHIHGNNGLIPTISKSIANDPDAATITVGVVRDDILNATEGHVQIRGVSDPINTTSWAVNDFLYLSDTVAGALTNVKPIRPNYIIPIGRVLSVATSGLIYIDPNINTAQIDSIDGQVASGDPTGWINRPGISISYDSANRTVTLTGDLRYMWRGQIIELASPWTSDPHPTTLDAGYFLLSNDGETWTWQTSPWEFDDMMIIFVNYGTSDKFGIVELHGTMPWQAHQEFHQTFGTYRIGGGSLSNFTLASTTATDRRPDISATTVKDEDIITPLLALTNNIYTQFYLTSTGIGSFNVGQSDIVPLSGTNPYYNQWNGATWQQTLVPSGDYMSVWVVAVPATEDSGSQAYRYLCVQGQNTGTLISQQALFPNDLNLGNLANLFTEFVFISKIVLQYTGADWQLADVQDLTGTRTSTSQASTSIYLSQVSSNASISGDGTSGSPLAVVSAPYASQVTLTDRQVSDPHYLPFSTSPATGNKSLYTDTALSYNPGSNVLSVGGISTTGNIIVGGTLSGVDTDQVSEGATNLYYTQARFDTAFAAKDTDDLSEGTTNLYYTDVRARNAISATGDISYNPTTGVISFTETGFTLDGVTTNGNTTTNSITVGGATVNGNIVTTGEIHGPSTLVIDPAAIGDNTGLVIIKGDFQVDGTTTTINSATLTVDDKIITLASGSANKAAADGAGVEIDLGVDGVAQLLTYFSGLDAFQFNKDLYVNADKVLTQADEGSGNGIDADTLDGQEGSFYQNASNINAGTIGDAYLPATISSDITGNAATATTATTAGSATTAGTCTGNAATATALQTGRTISLTGDVSGTSTAFDGTGNVSITATVANDSHTHATQYLGLTATAAAATKLATGRTISLTGGVSGTSTAFDGTGNVSITATVANDSHTHDTRYFTETEVTNNFLGITATATAAAKWSTARTITLGGDLTGNVSIDGSANVTLTAAVVNDSHSHSNYITSNANDTASGQVSFTNGISVSGLDVYFNNRALIANDTEGAFADRTGVNIDHIWHDEATNTWHFCSDTTYKNTGNAIIKAQTFDGVSTTAKYADLAENYVADKQYAPGTVVMFGGEFDVTKSDKANTHKVAGVVSTAPAHLMDGQLQGEFVVPVALQGKVPCAVIGKVEKGDLLVASEIPGFAMVNNDPKVGTVIGKALENKNNIDQELIMIVVGRD